MVSSNLKKKIIRPRYHPTTTGSGPQLLTMAVSIQLYTILNPLLISPLQVLSVAEWLPRPLQNIAQIVPLISPHEAKLLLSEVRYQV